MSGARWLACEMDGVKWMAWDERDEWCMVVRDEWWGISGERWVWWEMNVYMRRYVRCVRGVVYVRCCVRWMRWVVWNDGERWVMSDDWIKISGVRTATPNTVYTQQGAKLAYEQDISAKFSHLLSAQLPRTQFTHSKAPNPHARKTSTQNVCSSWWHSYPEHTLHTASCQTRMAATHQHKMFSTPIGTATPSDVYTQQAALLWILRLPQKQKPRPSGDTARF